MEYREDPESQVTGWQHRHTVIRDITINYTFGRFQIRQSWTIQIDSLAKLVYKLFCSITLVQSIYSRSHCNSSVLALISLL